MPAPISFGARTTRSNNYTDGANPQTSASLTGPGTYNLPSTLKSNKPSYAPFGSTARRNFIQKEDAGPAPGDYSTAPVDYKPAIRGPFKGDAPRIPSTSHRDMVPGPGEYYIPSSINAVPQSLAPVGGKTDRLSRIATAPSIPGSGQCYGYEEGNNGDLIMQRPVDKGYMGTGGSTVGPQDYKPKLTMTHKAAHVLDFGKGTARPDISGRLRNMGKDGYEGVPGPGSYNLGGKGEVKAARPVQPRKKNAVFESKVNRLKVKRRNEALGPSPQSYVIPSTLKVAGKPDNVQCFGTSSDRFANKEEMGPSPGSYGQPLSDFERRAMEARKSQVRYNSNAGNKQPVPFGTSGTRFTQKYDTGGAAPGSYDFTGGMVDELKQKLVGRSGAFGSSSKRFQKFKDQVEASDNGGGEIPLKLGASEQGGSSVASQRSKRPVMGRAEKSFLNNNNGAAEQAGGMGGTSSFAQGPPRLERPANSIAPPPGTYDVRVPWNANSVALSSGPADRIPKVKNYTGNIGPGDYNVPSTVGAKKSLNRKCIMVSTETRFGSGLTSEVEGPGPSSYYPEYHYGSLIRPTFNIAIAEASKQMF